MPVRVTFSDGHSEYLTFYEYTSHLQPVILEFPWLKRHNPLEHRQGFINNHCFSDKGNKSPVPTMTSKKFLARPKLLPCFLTDLMTVLLIFSQHVATRDRCNEGLHPAFPRSRNNLPILITSRHRFLLCQQEE